MRGKIQFQNRFTDLSLEINHLDSHISFDKNWFSRVKSRSVLSEFELGAAQVEYTWGPNSERDSIL
jgi:hypothetical protein